MNNNSRYKARSNNYGRSRNRSYNRNSSRGRNFSRNRRRGNSRNQNKPKLDRNLFINDRIEEGTKAKEDFVGIKYTSFNFNFKLQKNLDSKGFVETTKIQSLAIPKIVEGKDVLGISETGSGKTGAFLIPIIDKILDDSSQKLLVIAPTRELALQIKKEAVSFVVGTKINISLVIGGESMERQIREIKRNPQIVIGTPGRLNDLVKRRALRLGEVNNIVVDEVDRMMDMGFIHDIKTLFNQISNKRQSLFFSATHNKNVEKTVRELTRNFELIKLAQNEPSKSVLQSVVDYSDPKDKFRLLGELLNQKEVEKAIIFVETKRFADKVEKTLRRYRYKAGVIHGDKRQNYRKRMIDSFRYSKIQYLVATNVAARGIDIDDITHVINFDEPTDYDEYIHRIGRTGRNGKVGRAYTFVGTK